MAKYQTIRIVEKRHDLDYVFTACSRVNSLLRFLGKKIRDVQILEYSKRADIEYFVRYETSDSYELEVQEFIDNNYGI